MEKPSLTYIKELSGGDQTFEAKLIAVVQTELPLEIEEYEKNMENSAFAKAAENVHKLKHKLGILNLKESYELAITYEAELKKGNTEQKSEFESVLQQCMSFISNL